jgi:hypothetical protein
VQASLDLQNLTLVGLDLLAQVFRDLCVELKSGFKKILTMQGRFLT